MASGVAAAGAAVAFYFYTRKLKVCGFGGPPSERDEPADQHFEGAYQAPSTWMEALYFFAEALRYMYHESLARWKSSDLLIGLAYLAQQESANHAALDIAREGCLVGEGESVAGRQVIADNFRRFAHFMKFCQALRERHVPTQCCVLEKLGIAPEDVLMQQGFAGMLKPSFVMVTDRRAKCIVLAIRGTHSIKDMFTSLTSATKPHHMVVDSRVILGYSHFGMLAAARWVLQQTQATLSDALQNHPGYKLQIVGHSLGGGTAALLTARLREVGGVFADATCLAIACPACMTKELAVSCAGHTITIINGHDMIPTLSPGAADALREEVMQSSWYEAFRADLRSSVVVRAVEASLGSVTSLTSWTSASLSSATHSFRACYSSRGPQIGSNIGKEGKEEAIEEFKLGQIEDAKAWVDLQDDTEGAAWEDALETIQPIHSDQNLPERPAAGNSLRASWPPSKPQAIPTSAPPKSRGLWTRLWPNCSPLSQPGSHLAKQKVDEATQDSNFDSLQPPNSPTMEMARTLSDDLRYSGALDGPLSPSDDLDGLRTIWGSPLEKFLSDSDVDDNSQGEFRPMSKKERRRTFPAGKIYHLLPARLVFGETEAAKRRAQRLRPQPRDIDPHADTDSDKSRLTDESPAMFRERHTPESEGASLHCDSDDMDCFADVFREGVAGHFIPAPGEDPYVVITTSKAQGRIGVAPPIPPLEDLVLLQDIPQEMYGRIRLCKRMLADHFIPVYLGALETALDYLEHDYYQQEV